MPLKQILGTIQQSPYFKQHLSALNKNGKTSFSGLAGSSSSAISSSLINNFKGILIITSSTARAEAIKAEIELFSGKKAALFPAPDTLPGEEILPSKELVGERLAVLQGWDSGDDLLVVAPLKAAMWKTALRLETIRVSGNQVIRMDTFIEKLIEFGYKRFDIVGERGEFSVRGGIIDVFPLNFEHPVRLELAGDEVESIRLFDAYSQRSVEKLSQIVILPAAEPFEGPLFKHLDKKALIIFDEVMEISRAADKQIDELRGMKNQLKNARAKFLTFEEIRSMTENFKRVELSQFLAPDEEPVFTPPASYVNRLSEIPRDSIIISKHAPRLREEVEAQIFEGSLRAGFVFEGIECLSDKELFGEEVVFRKLKSTPVEGVADELLADLKSGDYVVHENYGIALYRGVHSLEIEGIKQEYLLLEFSGEDKVYVPPAMAGLIEKFSSGSVFKPRLSRLGTKQWARTKSRVRKELKDMTKELLELYAAREKLSGFAFPADDIWQIELEGTFAYEETPDQKKAIIQTKRDMESPHPMDRLVCGDVGYGKTEVAMRAAAKAVSAGKQVAILVPTTILAEQHFNNFKERFKSLPFNIEMLSRFRSKKEQAKVVKDLSIGGVDIVIGTHRLLSKDIKFKDLGLLIVDEEQRFGVGHKEKLKQLKKLVDVLTLTATPIPRTLYLSLSGARDMSTIHTAPVDRSPIRTYVLPYNEAVMREAILRELDRGGQIYFVHNFVETINGIASKIKKLVPEAKVAIGHGQMPEKELEKTMIDFLDRKYNVLVCTSIIESGLDIPNVNTILIDHADRFGLSQLYQIRGRVGRSTVRAYAYLFYHPEKIMTDTAIERLKAIQEFTALGSGYKLAMRDLEIRGAGNLLGAQQSGHIMEVGFDLYCELLDEAVREVKGIKQASPREVVVDLRLEAFIPQEYITDDRQRIAIYRRMNLLRSNEEVNEMKKELLDRFGKIPIQLMKLFELLYLKVKALKAGVESVKEEDGKAVIKWFDGRRKVVKLSKDKIRDVQQFVK
jgi:transcription-repair coupling factor (superfamily II helicase)